MTIAERLIQGDVDSYDCRYLLWISLCKLQEFTDSVDLDPEESFNIDEVLDSLDRQLGMLPGGF